LKDAKQLRKKGRIVHEMECQVDEMHKEVVNNDNIIKEKVTAVKTAQRIKMT
jgi:hypothetical protein